MVVVHLPPVFHDLASLAQALEPVLTQALVPQSTVGALDERVAHRLARADEVDRVFKSGISPTPGPPLNARLRAR